LAAESTHFAIVGWLLPAQRADVAKSARLSNLRSCAFRSHFAISISMISKQFIRYVAVGTLTNVSGYLLYLYVTSLGISPILTISIFYPVYIGVAFYLHKTLSFGHKGQLTASAIKYLVAYVGCYLLNVGMLAFFSDYLGFPHWLVQAGAVVSIALLLFVIQRYWIFRPRVTVPTIEHTL
jgi:putative flippase GtrA